MHVIQAFFPTHHEVAVPHGRCVLNAALFRRPGLLPHEGVEAEHAYQEAQQGHLREGRDGDVSRHSCSFTKQMTFMHGSSPSLSLFAFDPIPSVSQSGPSPFPHPFAPCNSGLSLKGEGEVREREPLSISSLAFPNKTIVG